MEEKMTSGPCEICFHQRCLGSLATSGMFGSHGKERKRKRMEVTTHHVTHGGSWSSWGSARTH